MSQSTKKLTQPIGHGDVASTCFGENCPPYEDQFNGTLAIIVENPKGDNYVAPLVTQPVSEKLWGKRNNPQIPTQYDLMPVYGQMAVYYRFLSK